MRPGFKKLLKRLKNPLFSTTQQADLEELQVPISGQADSLAGIDEQADKPLEQLSAVALQAIFRKEACCQLDGLNEYDDDFTRFQDLGEVITHEMQRALQQTAQQCLEKPTEPVNAALVEETTIDNNHPTPPRDLS